MCPALCVRGQANNRLSTAPLPRNRPIIEIIGTFKGHFHTWGIILPFAILVRRHLLIELNVDLLDPSTGAQPFPTNIRVIWDLPPKLMAVVRPSFYLMVSVIVARALLD